MDEHLWMREDRSSALFVHLQRRVSDRKFRLMAVAFTRAVWGAHIGPVERQVLEAIERDADALLGQVNPELARDTAPYRRHDQEHRAIYRILGIAAGASAREAADSVADRVVALAEPEEWDPIESTVCGLVREIAGNPFRRARFDADWRTETAVALARQMYEAREFSAMPILADALQDAGCADEQVLDHCRDPGPHVRGCWVVDLVLARE
jgi:hypothetical protein